MDTETTRALAEQFNEAWVNNDADKMATLLAEDVVQSYPPYTKLRKGRDLVCSYLTAQPGSTADDDLKVETMVRTIHKLLVDGNTAVGFHHMTAKMRKGGTYSNEYIWRLECADGKVVRIYGMVDRLHAIQQIGDRDFFHGEAKN